MKKNMLKRWCMIGAVLLIFAVSAAGCGNQGGNQDGSEAGDVSELPLYPVSLNGTEIRVGETTMQTLLDAGFKVTVSEMTEDNQINEYEVDPTMELEPNMYYTGGSIWITEHTFAHISFVTGETAGMLGDATIARLEVNLSSQDDAANLAKIEFNGTPVTELSREKAGEDYPDFTGDEGMWFSTGANDYKYGLYFERSSGSLTSFSAECEYDVDWSN